MCPECQVAILCRSAVLATLLLVNSLRLECRQDLKELKFRPSTDVHDYQVRLRSAQKFIAKVRAVLENGHQLSLHCGKAMPALSRLRCCSAAL